MVKRSSRTLGLAVFCFGMVAATSAIAVDGVDMTYHALEPLKVDEGQPFTITLWVGRPDCAVPQNPDQVDVAVTGQTIEIVGYFTCARSASLDVKYPMETIVARVPGSSAGKYRVEYSPRLRASAGEAYGAPWYMWWTTIVVGCPPGVARLAMVSGDRQIAAGSGHVPQPFVVRALDAADNPVSGVAVQILPPASGVPSPIDEFIYRGFAADGRVYLIDFSVHGVPAEYRATTDAEGLAAANGTLSGPQPSAFLVGASTSSLSEPTYFSVVKVASPPPGNPLVVVEYFNIANGHYFNTALQSEIDALDAGRFPGWFRSIGAFVAYATAADAPPGAVPVCRFFSSTYTSHFYTADPGECDAIIAKWPDVWKLETRAAFYIQVPDKATGTCAAGLQPIYRMYNTRNGPSHRYIADPRLRTVMVASGWVSEGYGPDDVMLCTAR